MIAEPRDHGDPQRDARLVLRRRALPRDRGRGRARPRAGGRRARRSSTSAASRRGPAPSRSAVEEELRRVVPVIEGLVAAGVGAEISIDTSKARGRARRARRRRDVRQRRHRVPRRARRSPRSSRERGVGCCLDAHAGRAAHDAASTRATATSSPRCATFLARARRRRGRGRHRARADHGRPRDRLRQDRRAQPRAARRACDELSALGLPILIGTSRKSFLGRLTGRGEEERLAGTIATNVIALLRGASVFRVHDVAPLRDALAVAAATVRRR